MKQEEYIQGKWYVVFTEKYYYIIRCQYVKDGKMWSSEVYFSDGDCDFLLGNTPIEKVKGLATPAQIEQCLKAYAEKNGYVQGAKVKSYYDIICLETSDVVYGDKYDILVSNGNRYIPAIYEKGQWAEIVAHAPSVQDKQDEALTKRIHEFVSNEPIIIGCPIDENKEYNLSRLYVTLKGKEVTLIELCETYYKMLEIKTIIG